MPAWWSSIPCANIRGDPVALPTPPTPPIRTSAPRKLPILCFIITPPPALVAKTAFLGTRRILGRRGMISRRLAAVSGASPGHVNNRRKCQTHRGSIHPGSHACPRRQAGCGVVARPGASFRKEQLLIHRWRWERSTLHRPKSRSIRSSPVVIASPPAPSPRHSRGATSR
jgi:hypothetical protein